jgi:Uma2 family endonuclease
MSEPVRRRATYQDVLDAPPEKIAEVIDGELYLSRPGLQQSAITAALSGLLGPPFHLGIDAPGTWTLLYAPELHLGDDIVVPSLAGWHRERMPVADETPFETSAPDWICEVLSASAEPLDRRAKMPIYAATE